MINIGFYLAMGAFLAFAMMSAVGGIVTLAVNRLRRSRRIGFDDSDNHQTGERSELKVYTDYRTGVQYIATRNGAITPRLGVNGEIMIEWSSR